MRINLYAQNRHTLIVDGVPISGFAEGDFLEIQIEGGAAARTKGADGPSMNISVPQGGHMLVSLLPTSPALGLLYEIRNDQNINPRMFTVVLTTGVEEIIAASGCGFGEMPAFRTGGPVMQPRQFLIEALQISLDTSAIETIAGGFIGGLI